MISRKASYDLSARNTFRMKVSCALFIEVTEEKDLQELDWDALPKPLMVIGGGSNLLFTKEYFPGTVLHLSISHSSHPISHSSLSTCHSELLSCHSERSEESITLGAGTVFDDFCAWAAAEGLWGPENLSLIPGEVGASAVQNIGAYGVEAKDIIAGIRAWDLQERRFVDIDPADCEYGYRTSRFKTSWKGRYIITAVTYKLSREPKPILDYGGIRKALEARGTYCVPENLGPSVLVPPISDGPLPLMCRGRQQFSETQSVPLTPQIIRDTIIDIRKKKLPAVEEIGSAGSFFCNPVISKEHFERIVATAKADNGADYEVPHYVVGDKIKVPAAWMIEQCGFKGKRLGGAQVYQNQPLVIVNASGEATAEEIIGLETEVIQAIESKYGITLHPEVEHV